MIPTCNEVGTVQAAIASARQHQPIEIIVSDGDSGDATRSIARQMTTPEIPVIVINEARGRGRQLAAGAKHATGDVILFLHSDNRLQGNAHEQMHAAGWPIWGAFEQRIDDHRWRYRWLEWGNALRVSKTSRVFGDQAMFVHRACYDEVGGFDDVDLMEDVMISAKLKRIAPATLLPGKLIVDPRRWHTRGVVGQTLRNWWIQFAFALGVSPSTLKTWYR